MNDNVLQIEEKLGPNVWTYSNFFVKDIAFGDNETIRVYLKDELIIHYISDSHAKKLTAKEAIKIIKYKNFK